MYDIIIVGAGPAGLSAAIYGVRSGKTVLVLEKSGYGGQIINTPEIENYPGIKNVSGYDFATNLYEQAKDLGAKVVYTNRTRYKELEKEYNVEYLSLDELLAQSDIVSLHLAVTPQTVNTVDSKFISKMKKDAFLINTSRGDLVDNDALKNALLNGEIAGAGLDVYTPEPLLKDNTLLDERLKNKLILTPHIAGITDFTVEKIYKNIAENTQNIILKKELKNRVN